MRPSPTFDVTTIDGLTIIDERSFRHVPLYADLKAVIQQARYQFRILPKAYEGRTDRSLLLNLVFWGAASAPGEPPSGDVLASAEIDADVIAHVAWHHLAARALAEPSSPRPSVDALFLGESIASAFDLFLVGRLLNTAPRSVFLESQVPAMAEAATASISEDDFARLLESVAMDPNRAFADLRELLFDVTSALYACAEAGSALAALSSFDDHRFAPLLYHYELSTWVLFARAYGGARTNARTDAVLGALAEEKDPLGWLAKTWIGH
jgi:hypothetical protein